MFFYVAQVERRVVFDEYLQPKKRQLLQILIIIGCLLIVYASLFIQLVLVRLSDLNIGIIS